MMEDLEHSNDQQTMKDKPIAEAYEDDEELKLQEKEIDQQEEKIEELDLQEEEIEEIDLQDEEVEKFTLQEEEIELDLQESEEEDEAIVKDILNTLTTRQDSKDSDDSGYIDLFETINEPDPNDLIVEDTLALLHKTERSIELQNLGLERLNANLFKGFCSVEYLYLQNNKIASLSYDFFPALNRLKYLDLRNNRLVTLPCSVCYHDCLEVLLLQNNCIQRAPKELGSLPRLRGIHMSHNPLRYPTPSVVSQGPRGILEYLRTEWRQVESSAAVARQRAHGMAGAGDVLITARVETVQDEKTDATNTSADSKKNRKSLTTNSTPKQSFVTDSAFFTGGDTIGSVKYENINYKDDAVCMYVSKIRPKKVKKNILLPNCTEENKDTTSQNSSYRSHCTKAPCDQSAQSSISATKRRKKKLQHYSEILNPYSPLRSCSEPLDENRTQSMYLRKLVEIHRKFIASTRDRMLQRMRDKEVLDEWRDEYREKCGTELSQRPSKRTTLPFAVYKEFEKMMTRQELAESQVEEKATRPAVRVPVAIADQERYMESKMADLQTTLNKIDCSLRTYQKSDGLISCADGLEKSLNADQGQSRGLTHAEGNGGGERQRYLLQQICMMQELRSQIKSLSKFNDAIL